MRLVNKIYRGREKLSIPQYDALPALRSTSLKKFMVSPAHYKHDLDSPDTSDKAHFILGSYVHSIILEPELTNESYVSIDVSGRNTNIYKDTRKKLEGSGKQLILKSEVEIGNQIKAESLKDEAFKALVDACEPEVTAVAQIDDVWIKARFDGLIETPEGWVIFDIKTTSDNLYYFPSNIQKYGYDVSCSLYIDAIEKATGIPVVQFTFAVLEKPLGFVKLFDMTQEYVEFGRNKYRPHLAKYLECLKSNVWPAYDNTKERRLLPPI